MKHDGYALPDHDNYASKRHTQPPKKGRHRTRKKGNRVASSLIYGDLRKSMVGLSVPPSTAAAHARPQVLANLSTALGAFQRQFGLTDASPVGRELSIGFIPALQTHLQALNEAGLAAQTLKDRKSRLRRWKKLADELYLLHSDSNGNRSLFQAVLQGLLHGRGSLLEIATQAQVSKTSLGRWLNGVLPTRRAIPSLRRLEQLLAVPNGTLTDTVLIRGAFPIGDAVACKPIAYRERLRKQSAMPYHLHVMDVSDSLRDEWTAFVAYKTSLATTAARHANGVWRLRPVSTCSQSMISWATRVGEDSVAPTASIVWGYVSSYLGWLTLPRDKGGRGIPLENVQTLSWLTRVDEIVAYVNWQIGRAGRLMHGGIASFLNLVLSLANPTTGYLRHNPHPLPGTGDWAAACTKVFDVAKMLKAQATRQDKQSRDPFAPIEHIIALTNPFDGVIRMIEKMRLDRPTPGTVEEAIWARDILLIRLLARYPLRALNIKNLEFDKDAPTRLYESGGAWYMHADKEVFKNEKGAAKDRDYHIAIDPTLWGDIEAWKTIYKKRLESIPTNYVFISSRPSKQGKIWSNLNRRISRLTRRYLEGCLGVGPHTFRHLYATSVLKQHPGEITAVAYALHDKEETVRRYYRRFLVMDGFTRVKTLFPESLDRM